ncbi:serine/threonine protein kinase [Dictyobacter arantiisoli]|uniref:Protein kinase domain-containing protein n=1 Tax=Dictyobacter arantiisoli TaxID=2014874 RepID=A0A5A5TA49_9CHLR|nr:serine/threonine-protein kinase [Dictyobacter arantiisoli]GCF08390.1 hypothetical protein KDI_19540 [Dictyobacter arantiisoli]
MLSLEGKQLGNYDITRRIRVGGMGAVYEGRQRTAFDRRVAIKVILGDYAADPDMRRRFAREAKTVARLQHPHILPLIEFGDEQGILYLVMPFIDGGTLTSYLRHNLPGTGEVATLYEQILDAVEYAHDHGLIHRDIKSSNVLLDLKRNTAPYAYLADFGLVRTVRQNASTQVGKPIPLEQVPGTPHYMAPEQTLGIVTPLTDIYALGVLLFQMLTGNLPYNDPDEVRVIQMHLQAPIPSPCEDDASIPAELGDVVNKAMAKDPQDRYKNVAALRTAFQRALKGPTITLPVTEDVKPGHKPTRPISLDELTGEIEPAAPNGKNRKTAALGRPMEPPRPIIMHQRPRGGEVQPSPPATTIREKRERSARNARPEYAERTERLNRPEVLEYPEKTERPYRAEAARQRITEEPMRSRPVTRRPRRLLFLFLIVLVPLLLLMILLLSQLTNGNGTTTMVSWVGGTSTANIHITPKASVIQNAFLLTASPQTQTSNLDTHTIPDRWLSVTEQSSVTVNTTGKNTIQGQQAHGMVQLTNANKQPVTVPKSLMLNAANGVQIQLTQDTTVPGKQDTQPGKIEVPAQAVQAGQVGNIPPNAISGTCCQPTLFINNPSAFQGGVDGSSTHFVAQSDLDNAKNGLVPQLEQQINQQLNQQIKSGESTFGQADYQIISVESDNPVNASADKVQVKVKIQGRLIVYQKNVAVSTAMVLLNRDAQKKLGDGYQLQGKPTLIGEPSIKAGKNGILYLTLNVKGTWIYSLSATRIKKLTTSIKGNSSDAAKTYLQKQPGIAAVDIQLPFGSNHLPTITKDINITLTSPDPNQGS